MVHPSGIVINLSLSVMECVELLYMHRRRSHSHSWLRLSFLSAAGRFAIYIFFAWYETIFFCWQQCIVFAWCETICFCWQQCRKQSPFVRYHWRRNWVSFGFGSKYNVDVDAVLWSGTQWRSLALFASDSTDLIP
jgi:hypothetical protein